MRCPTVMNAIADVIASETQLACSDCTATATALPVLQSNDCDSAQLNLIHFSDRLQNNKSLDCK